MAPIPVTENARTGHTPRRLNDGLHVVSLAHTAFFLEQWAFFNLQLIGEKERARLVLGALYVELNFVREIRREPRAAHDTDLIAWEAKFRNGLCETDEIIDCGLSHATSMHHRADREKELPMRCVTALRNHLFPKILLGEPHTHANILALISRDARLILKFFSCFCQREIFNDDC